MCSRFLGLWANHTVRSLPLLPMWGGEARTQKDPVAWEVEECTVEGDWESAACLLFFCSTVWRQLCCHVMCLVYSPTRRLFHNFISCPVFYYIALSSVRLWNSSSTAILVWKVPSAQHLQPQCLECLTKIRNSSKSYSLYFKSIKVCNILSGHNGLGIWFIK